MDQKEIIRLRKLINKVRYENSMREDRIEVADLALQWFSRYTTMDLRRREVSATIEICVGNRQFELSWNETMWRAEQWLKEWSDYNLRLAAEQRNK